MSAHAVEGVAEVDLCDHVVVCLRVVRDVALGRVDDGLGATCDAHSQLEWLEMGRDLLTSKLEGNFPC